MKSPPMLNMAPLGFKPGFITSSFYLCPGNMEYWFADELAPRVHALGISPNAVTVINCLFVRLPSLYLLIHGYFLPFIIALLANQVLDCLDGQIARRYKCGTEFGAWLDHTTDSVYFVSVALLTLYVIEAEQGLSKTFFVIFLISLLVGVLGFYSIRVKEEGKHWSTLTFVETMGSVQEWYVCYIYIAIYGTLFCIM